MDLIAIESRGIYRISKHDKLENEGVVLKNENIFKASKIRHVVVIQCLNPNCALCFPKSFEEIKIVQPIFSIFCQKLPEQAVLSTNLYLGGQLG